MWKEANPRQTMRDVLEKYPARCPMAELALLVCAVLCGSCYRSSSHERDGNGEDEALPEAQDAAEEREGPGDIQPEMPEAFPPEIPADPPMDEADDEVPGVTWEEYCRRMYAAGCAFYTACCTGEELDELNVTEGRNCSSPHEDLRLRSCMEFSMEEQEFIIIDETALETCERAWQESAGACLGYGLSPEVHGGESCWSVLHGALGEGESCEYIGWCGDGLYCNEWEGVCLPRMGVGGECREYDECLEGLTCYGRHCIEMSGEGGPCHDDLDCLGFLWCDGETCRPLLPAGESCEGHALWACEGICLTPSTVCGDFCNGL